MNCERTKVLTKQKKNYPCSDYSYGGGYDAGYGGSRQGGPRGGGKGISQIMNSLEMEKALFSLSFLLFFIYLIICVLKK